VYSRTKYGTVGTKVDAISEAASGDLLSYKTKTFEDDVLGLDL
jgi:hypothetical protein